MWLDLPELRPWRWYLAAIVCFAVGGHVVSWVGLVLVTIGLFCACFGLTSYARGHDGLSKYRQ